MPQFPSRSSPLASAPRLGGPALTTRSSLCLGRLPPPSAGQLAVLGVPKQSGPRTSAAGKDITKAASLWTTRAIVEPESIQKPGQVEEEVPPTGPRKVPPLPSRLGQLLLVMPSVYVCLCDAIMVHYFWKKSKQGAYGAGKGTPSRKREDMIELFVPPLCFRKENSS